MSANEVSANIELLKASVKILDELMPGSWFIPVSTDATQISRQVWEAAQVTIHDNKISNGTHFGSVGLSEIDEHRGQSIDGRSARP